MYYGEWDCKKDVMEDFGRSLTELEEEFATVDILVAWYDYHDYDGDAFVLFQRDGKLYEVHGGHCSCFGLEEQWQPEETTAESMLRRMEKGCEFSYEPKDRIKKLKKLLKAWMVVE